MHLEFGKQDKIGPDYIGGNILLGLLQCNFLSHDILMKRSSSVTKYN